jgi:hypothetical protein
VEAVNRRSPLLAAFAILVTLAVTRPGPARAEPTEQTIKAALIFNITRFVEWPASAFPSPNAPLVVAILGQDDVAGALEPMLLNKSVGGHPFEVRRVLTVEEARGGHVLYVAASEKRHAREVLKELRGTATLTIADFERFGEMGGHVDLVWQDRRVRVFVNPESATESRLKISAKLLSLAQIVRGTP